MNEKRNNNGGNERMDDCAYSQAGECMKTDAMIDGLQADDTSEKMQEVSEVQGAPCPACSARRKERSEKEYKYLMNRLNRVEGQIRGIKRMLEKDAYCTDIITQVMAANAALDSFNRVLLAEHIRTCVTDDIKEDKTESVEELISLIGKLQK